MTRRSESWEHGHWQECGVAGEPSFELSTWGKFKLAVLNVQHSYTLSMLLKTFQLARRQRWPRSWAKHFSTPQRSLITSSYVEGPTDAPLNSNTLSNYFERELLPNYASRPALICKKERPGAHSGPQLNNLGREDCLAWSFEDFDKHIGALARGLISLGVKKGDRVGVVMGNNR